MNTVRLCQYEVHTMPAKTSRYLLSNDVFPSVSAFTMFLFTTFGPSKGLYAMLGARMFLSLIQSQIRDQIKDGTFVTRNMGL